ncbi:unnamed protein product [Ixodes persulcatus]
MLVVNVGECDPLNLGVPRNVREDSILHCVCACVEVRSFFCMVLASERFVLSNQDVLPWRSASGRQIQPDGVVVRAYGVLVAPPLPYQASVNPGQGRCRAGPYEVRAASDS